MSISQSSQRSASSNEYNVSDENEKEEEEKTSWNELIDESEWSIFIEFSSNDQRRFDQRKKLPKKKFLFFSTLKKKRRRFPVEFHWSIILSNEKFDEKIVKLSSFRESSTSQTKRRENLRIDDFLSAPSTFTRKNAPIFGSALNICYQNSLLRLKETFDDLPDEKPLIEQQNPSNVTDDDFHVTIFPDRTYSPKLLTISEWRHDASMTDRFVSLLQKLVREEIYSIVFNLIDLELKTEEERQRKMDRRKTDLETKMFQLKQKKKTIDLESLYEISETSQEILFEQIDWKSICTLMRKFGGFKYFDEYILKRFWICRGQFPVKSSWSIDEDRRLDELVNRIGFGQWERIAQDEIFRKNRKSALMCARHFMIRSNQNHGDRSFTRQDKSELVAIHKRRCTTNKDYRFSISYASYYLGDRTCKKISQIWSHLNPDLRRSLFSTDDDAILLRHATNDPMFSWENFATKFFVDRSATQCRRRYFQLLRPEKPTKSKRVMTINLPSQIAIVDTSESNEPDVI